MIREYAAGGAVDVAGELLHGLEAGRRQRLRAMHAAGAARRRTGERPRDRAGAVGGTARRAVRVAGAEATTVRETEQAGTDDGGLSDIDEEAMEVCVAEGVERWDNERRAEWEAIAREERAAVEEGGDGVTAEEEQMAWEVTAWDGAEVGMERGTAGGNPGRQGGAGDGGRDGQRADGGGGGAADACDGRRADATERAAAATPRAGESVGAPGRRGRASREVAGLDTSLRDAATPATQRRRGGSRTTAHDRHGDGPAAAAAEAEAAARERGEAVVRRRAERGGRVRIATAETTAAALKRGIAVGMRTAEMMSRGGEGTSERRRRRERRGDG